MELLQDWVEYVVLLLCELLVQPSPVAAASSCCLCALRPGVAQAEFSNYDCALVCKLSTWCLDTLLPQSYHATVLLITHPQGAYVLPIGSQQTAHTATAACANSSESSR